MAEDGWYTYTRDLMLLVAQDRNVIIPSGSSVLDTAFLMNKALLKCSDLDAVETAGKPLAYLSQQDKWVKELMLVDEAMELLDRDEYQQMNERQKKGMGVMEERHAFASEYQKARAKLGAPKLPKGYPAKIPLAFNQATVKKFIPPGSSIWRGNTRGEWWAHVKPYSRVVRRVSDYESEKDCILAVLQESWRQFNEKSGLMPTACPVEGIF